MYTIPTQFHNNTLEWVIDYAKGLFPVETLYRVIHQAESIELPAPKGFDPVRWSTTCHYLQAFTAIIPYGRVVTGNAYVVTPADRRLRDVELHYDYGFNNLPDPVYTEETIATLIWGWNLPGRGYTQAIYGHWFYDILPRIHLLEASGIAIDKYLIGKLTHRFQWETLEMIGFPVEKLIQVEQDDYHLMARNLIVPAVPVILGKCPRWAFQFIRQRLMLDHNVAKHEGYERIYVTRQDAQWRHVINEDQVVHFLEQKGFKKITLTPLTTLDKVAIYSSAQIIVAPFGSGNANLAFCNPGTKVIEMTPITVIDDYFWKLCGHAQLDYYQLLCEIDPPARTPVGADSLIVDMAKLETLLALAGI